MTRMTSEVTGLPRGRALTRDDLHTMPDDGHRYELIDGLLIVSPAPSFWHQDLLLRLAVTIFGVIPDDLTVLTAPFDVVLAQDTVIQPDLLVAPRADFTDRDLPLAPLLAVEVLSPSTRRFDLMLKRERLQRAGCRHYWVFDPDEPSVLAFTLDGDVYVESGRALGDELFSATEPFEISFTLRSLTGQS
ncbi:Uma2 family endonuclease [Gordonia amarae]|uniref:Uma2 family endonuclease n=1 Tax=Gordonia amarae TaxID=36821 RepID=UPI0021B42ED3|nr:Uma2 family endonuclease [Gordonia amarae]